MTDPVLEGVTSGLRLAVWFYVLLGVALVAADAAGSFRDLCEPRLILSPFRQADYWPPTSSTLQDLLCANVRGGEWVREDGTYLDERRHPDT